MKQDILSRQPLPEIDVTEKTDSVFAMAGQTISGTSQGVDLAAVRAAIAHDEALASANISSLSNGNWNKQNIYFAERHRLSAQDDVILYDGRIVIPQAL